VRPGRAWVPYAAVIVIIAIALIVSGLRGSPRRIYALGAPNQGQVAGLRPGGRPVCEGPITTPAVVGKVRVWAVSRGPGQAQVVVYASDHPASAPLATGRLTVGATPDPYITQLQRPLSSHGPITVCVTSASTVMALYGAPPADPTVVIHAGAKQVASEFSLVLFSTGRPSFWSDLGTIADRASLFRFGWVGPWTIWLLGAALLVAVVAGGVAITRAVAEDGADGEPGP